MASMDVFNTDPFSLIALSSAIDRMPYKPGFLGTLGIFEPEPVNQSTIWVDERDGAINLIPTTPRGAPPVPLVRDSRKARNFKIPRLAKQFRVYATEIAGMRAFGSDSEQEMVMREYSRRMQRANDDLELTFENMRLGALKGILLDADGSTIYNYFTEFGITPAADVSFALTTDTTDVAGIARQLSRSMARSAKGAMGAGASVHAIVGDAFYDALIAHPQVRQTYLNWSAASDLRDQAAFGDFKYGGVVWHNYRGTDDNSTVAVGTNEALFFPVNAPGVYSQVMAPFDEAMEYVGTRGQRSYAINFVDRDRGFWTQGEVYAFPLFMSKRPEVIRKGTRT